MKVRSSNAENIFPRTSRRFSISADRLLVARLGQGHYHIGDAQLEAAFHSVLGGGLP